MPTDDQKKDDLADALSRMTSGQTQPPAPRPNAPAPQSSPRPRPAAPFTQSTRIQQHGPARPDVAVPSPVEPSSPAAPAFTSSTPRRPPARQPWTQSIEFRRTLIPILFTLALVCAVVGSIGYFVDGASPYHLLAEPQYSIPLLGLSVLFVAALLFTMLHVRHDLRRQNEKS